MENLYNYLKKIHEGILDEPTLSDEELIDELIKTKYKDLISWGWKVEGNYLVNDRQLYIGNNYRDLAEEIRSLWPSFKGFKSDRAGVIETHLGPCEIKTKEGIRMYDENPKNMDIEAGYIFLQGYKDVVNYNFAGLNVKADGMGIDGPNRITGKYNIDVNTLKISIDMFDKSCRTFTKPFLDIVIDNMTLYGWLQYNAKNLKKLEGDYLVDVDPFELLGLNKKYVKCNILILEIPRNGMAAAGLKISKRPKRLKMKGGWYCQVYDDGLI